MRQTHTATTCPNCNTAFDRIPLDYNEDGTGYAVLPVTPCATCGALLCPCCHFFACDGCGQLHCADHLVSVPDGTDRPLHCCADCASECEPLPLPFPPASETRPRLAQPAIA